MLLSKYTIINLFIYGGRNKLMLFYSFFVEKSVVLL